MKLLIFEIHGFISGVMFSALHFPKRIIRQSRGVGGVLTTSPHEAQVSGTVQEMFEFKAPRGNRNYEEDIFVTSWKRKR